MNVQKLNMAAYRTALVLGIISLLLLMLGFGSPVWVKAQSERHDQLTFGLWKACYIEQQAQGNTTACHLSNTFMIEDLDNWLLGVQSMMVFAVLSGGMCVVCLSLYLLAPCILAVDQAAAIFGALNSSFCTGVLTFLSVLVFGVQQASDDVNFHETSLHWGFTVTVMSLFLMATACVLLSIKYYDILTTRSEYKDRFSLHRKTILKVLNTEILKNGTKNCEDDAVYHDPANAAFEGPLGFENRAFVGDVHQRKRRGSRHVYDNNIKTCEGFRIYDNAIDVNATTGRENEMEEHVHLQSSDVKGIFSSAKEDPKINWEHTASETSVNGERLVDTEENTTSLTETSNLAAEAMLVPTPDLLRASKIRHEGTNSCKEYNIAHAKMSVQSSKSMGHSKDPVNSQTLTRLFTMAQPSDKPTQNQNVSTQKDNEKDTRYAVFDSKETVEEPKPIDNTDASQNLAPSTHEHSPQSDITVKAEIHSDITGTEIEVLNVKSTGESCSTSPVTMTENDVYDAENTKYF